MVLSNGNMLMKKHVYLRGGVWFDKLSLTWPFASLEGDAEYLKISTVFSSAYRFHYNQIFNISVITIIPIIAWGIVIEHNIESYPHRVIFWCLGNPHRLLRRLSSLNPQYATAVKE